jgi:hypothetical protein
MTLQMKKEAFRSLESMLDSVHDLRIVALDLDQYLDAEDLERILKDIRNLEDSLDITKDALELP